MFQDGHDYMDAGGKATQEAKAEDKHKDYIHINFIFRNLSPKVLLILKAYPIIF